MPKTLSLTVQIIGCFLLIALFFTACGNDHAPPSSPPSGRELIPEPDRDLRLAAERYADSLAALADSTSTAPAAAPDTLSLRDDAYDALRLLANEIDAITNWETVADDQAIRYYQDGELYRINTFWKGQITGNQTIFYLVDDALFLVRERYVDPENGLMEDRSFFLDGRLVRRFEDGDAGAPFAEEYLAEIEQDLLFYFMELTEE